MPESFTKRTYLKLGIVVLLLLFCIYIWHTAYQTFTTDREALIMQMNDIFSALALPIKMAKLATEDPQTSLAMPVYNVRIQNVADTWGEARSEGRSHEGVDIFAPRGTPVFAATRGYVIRTGESRLGGNYVFTVGPGGVRYYYAHLDSIADGMTTGTPVTIDTVVGYVGDTGNASGTPPHLHFGVYQKGAQNPYSLLQNRNE